MKILLPIVLAGGLLAGARGAEAPPEATPLDPAQDPAGGQQESAQAQPKLEARVAALEAALAQEKARHQETRRLLEETLAYLGRQAQASEAMLATLTASEEAGFTAGINFQSREILLRGWRDFHGTLQTDVPQLPAPPAEPPAQGRPARGAARGQQAQR